jgi:hypothetical protein
MEWLRDLWYVADWRMWTEVATWFKWVRNPNWWQVILTVVGAWVAYRAFISERNAVRLTQRAEVLLEGIGMKPRFDPPAITTQTVISLHFKNFGPTRASNVTIDAELEVPGVPHAGGTLPELPPMLIAAGDSLSTTLAPLGMWWSDEVIATAGKGDITLRFKADVRYTDVFGKDHRTRVSGRYLGDPAAKSNWIIEENNDAS